MNLQSLDSLSHIRVEISASVAAEIKKIFQRLDGQLKSLLKFG